FRVPYGDRERAVPHSDARRYEERLPRRDRRLVTALGRFSELSELLGELHHRVGGGLILLHLLNPRFNFGLEPLHRLGVGDVRWRSRLGPSASGRSLEGERGGGGNGTVVEAQFLFAVRSWRERQARGEG